MELAFARKGGQERGGLVSEARTGKRFPLELPIKIHRADEGGEHSGVTGNLSAAGGYLRADAAMEVGSTVEFEIALPAEVTGAKENVIIHFTGRAVSSDDPASSSVRGDSRGVVCVNDSYDFVPREYSLRP